MALEYLQSLHLEIGKGKRLKINPAAVFFGAQPLRFAKRVFLDIILSITPCSVPFY